MPAGAKKKTKRVKSEDRPDEESAIEARIRAALITGFHRAQQSTSSHASQRKIIFGLLDEHRDLTLRLLCALCVKTLSMQQSTDVSRRHAVFLSDVCKTLQTERKDDGVAARILDSVVPYHGARDKTVRFAVVCLMEPLLRTLQADNTDDDRQILYDTIVEAMKLRVFDAFYAVRERAVAALSIFQAGKKDCDVTQHILAASAEDTNPSVRRQCANVAIPKEAFFMGLSRLACDTVPAVRKAAWEGIAKFKHTHFVAFCTLYKVSFIDTVYTGLNDTSLPVRLAAARTLGKWLERDWKDDPVQFLSSIALPPTESPAVTLLARTLFDAASRRRGREQGPLLLPLVKSGLTPANAVMWRICCEAAVRSGDAAEVNVLPPLVEFAAVLRDAIETFIQQETAQCRVVQFANPEYADHILRVLLVMVPLYEEGGYLAHADDQARGALVKNLGSLLKVVTDSDPGLFVEDTMRALRLIGARHPAQVETAVHDVLHLLFKSLTLPRMYELGYDDVEMFGRKDYDRRLELRGLHAQPAGSSNPERARLLQESLETDTLYLSRMLHIVLRFLGSCKRGDAVPPYCAHFIQLGRSQCDKEIAALAASAMGVQCLLAPQTVHTFLPLILRDAMPPADGTTRLIHTAVSEAALQVIFDLLAEYPPSFFNEGDAASFTKAQAAEQRLRAGLADDAGDEDRKNLREDAVAAITADGTAKVGTLRLLRVTRAALVSEFPTLRRIAMRGYAKLLSCGRLQGEQQVEMLALVLINLFTFEAPASQRRGGKADVVGAFMYDHIDFFVRSYGASDPRRMRLVGDATVLAVRLICTRQAQPEAPLPALRLLKRAALYTDAALLQAAQEVDPEFAADAFEAHTAGDQGPAADDGEADTSTTVGRRSGASLSSRGGARLWRVLSKYSQHERLAAELLRLVAVSARNPGAQRCAISVLPHLRLYGRDAKVESELADLLRAAKSAAASPDIADAVDTFESAVSRVASSAAATVDADEYPDDADRETSPQRASALSVVSTSTKVADAWAARVEELLEGIGENIIAEGSLLRGRPSLTSTRGSKAHRGEGASSSVAARDSTQQNDDTSQDLVAMVRSSRGSGRR